MKGHPGHHSHPRHPQYQTVTINCSNPVFHQTNIEILGLVGKIFFLHNIGMGVKGRKRIERGEGKNKGNEEVEEEKEDEEIEEKQ